VLAPQNLDRYSSNNPSWVGSPFKVFFEVMGRLGGAALFAMGVVAVISVFVRLRSAEEEKRQQIKWFAYAAVLLLGCLYNLPLMWWVPLRFVFAVGVMYARLSMELGRDYDGGSRPAVHRTEELR
jgi:hypothetical protein